MSKVKELEKKLALEKALEKMSLISQGLAGSAELDNSELRVLVASLYKLPICDVCSKKLEDHEPKNMCLQCGEKPIK